MENNFVFVGTFTFIIYKCGLSLRKWGNVYNFIIFFDYFKGNIEENISL